MSGEYGFPEWHSQLWCEKLNFTSLEIVFCICSGSNRRHLCLGCFPNAVYCSTQCDKMNDLYYLLDKNLDK